MLFLYALVAMCLADNIPLGDGGTITLVDICDGVGSLTTNVSGLTCPITGDATYVAASQEYYDISVTTGSTEEYTIDATGTDASRFGDHGDLTIDRYGSTSGANLGIKVCDNSGCPVVKESGDWYTSGSSWSSDTIYVCQPSANNYYMQANNPSGQSDGDATADATFAVYINASGWCNLLEAFKNLGKIIVIIVVVMCAICCLCVVILIACCGMSIGGICWCCCAKKEQNATTVQMGS
jgi:hypothetical protein